MIKVREKNIEYSVESGTKVSEFVKNLQKQRDSKIVAAKINGELRELTYQINEDCKIEFIDMNTSDGIRIYQRSLLFVFLRAIMEKFEGIQINVKHSLSKGLYCETDFEHNLSPEDLLNVEETMRQIIKDDVPFVKELMPRKEAVKLFENYKMYHKSNLLKYKEDEFVNIYSCGWLKNYFYGYMLPSTGYIDKFCLLKYDRGIILRHPTNYSFGEIPEFVETPKLASIFNESEYWGEILGVSTVANLNDYIEKGMSGEIIRIAEALHEKKIAKIADLIAESGKRVILIAGPSSSGKTTFANRLKIQLKVNGLNPVTLSTDDYFVDREFTPRDENGDYDFESIKAVDVKQFNKDLNALLMGEEVALPTFDFKFGKREYKGNKLKIDSDQLVIIEGIHGLNEEFTKDVFRKNKFKIYISALTQLNIDCHNRVPTTDTRLIRRMVRDYKYRGKMANETIMQWPSVRSGEERNIFPYQEDADIMFNSALVYELSLLKKYAEPLLKEIKTSDKAYSEAKRILKMLSYFRSIENDDLVMNISILKEFIGGSSFRE